METSMQSWRASMRRWRASMQKSGIKHAGVREEHGLGARMQELGNWRLVCRSWRASMLEIESNMS